jgi:hypothetical protein
MIFFFISVAEDVVIHFESFCKLLGVTGKGTF